MNVANIEAKYLDRVSELQGGDPDFYTVEIEKLQAAVQASGGYRFNIVGSSYTPTVIGELS